tara:strand:+ start:84 stop:665 length:582 start_codon:yes stop_codon:yes gene_type:complete
MISVQTFEKVIANYFGAPYGIATDCCTNAIDLALRLTGTENIKVPVHTYISVPYMLLRNNWKFEFTQEKWIGYYHLTERVVDAAVYFKEGGYKPNTLMCVSFFKRKHLSTGRGGIILLDNKSEYEKLIKLVYDGRDRSKVPFTEQKLGMGYHYYMGEDAARMGLKNFKKVKDKPVKPKNWDWYKDVREYSTVF